MDTTSSLISEHRQVRQHSGYFLLDDWCLVAASGKETLSFLQSQTTNDVLSLEVGSGIDNAITDRKAKLLAHFSVHRDSDLSVLLLVETAHRDKLVQTLESFHFREDIQFNKNVPWDCLIALQGPQSPVILETITGTLAGLIKNNDVRTVPFEDGELLILSKNLTGEDGFILACSASLKEILIQRIQEAGEAFGILSIENETREVLRIEAGLPRFGRDMDERHILPETGLEHSAVSYHKGCYTGQEIIARMKTYGSPAFALMGLLIEGDALPPFNGEIKIENKKIGVIKSGIYSPSLESLITLAYIQKEHRSPGQKIEVTVEGQPFTVTTSLLPFYQTVSKTERAEKLHQQALTLYKTQESLNEPIQLLREAIALDPKYAPGYEALGVMLSKQNKLDEAISLMKRLAEIDPQEIMAHTNLSIYYMQQGRIEDAEMEKAEATALQFEKMIEASQAKKAKQKQAVQDEAERDRQMEMFKKVLEIDPVDQVANFGLGSVYFDREQFEDALPYLKTVVEHFQDYSAAYLLLGKTLEKLSRRDEASEVYQKGIAAASKKGDLMPLKDMQSRLNQILHSES